MGRGQRAGGAAVIGLNVVMRICHWCEDLHPEHLSIAWFPDRAYFCSDGCHQEWAESSGCGA